MEPVFFQNNRARLFESLNGGSVVLGAYTAMQNSNDMAADFEQEANFWWLTGIEKPDWWLIIDGGRHKSILVAPSTSDIHAIFDGSLNYDDAMKVSGVDSVISRSEGEAMLVAMARVHSLVYTLGNDPIASYVDFSLNPAPKRMHELVSRIFKSVQDCRKDLAMLRAIKQPVEIAALKTAIKLTCKGFEQAKQRFQDYTYEYEIEADFSHYFRNNGGYKHAYQPIVGAGKNACTLHYIENNTKLKKRQLVLMDIGARVNGYPADISRTYAYGEATKRQQAVHRAVQTAQQEIIGLLEPGLAVSEYHQSVDRIMKTVLLGLGLLKNLNDERSYRNYFPHAISHGLGVDVHDSLGAPRVFKPGMVLTVEPGIYSTEESIGVRLEDNILITETGYENLSRSLSTDL